MHKWDFETMVKNSCKSLKKYAEANGVRLSCKLETGWASDDSMYVSWEVERDGDYDSGLSAFSNIDRMDVEEAAYRIQKELGRRIKAVIDRLNGVRPQMSFSDFKDLMVNYAATNPAELLIIAQKERFAERPIVILYTPNSED